MTAQLPAAAASPVPPTPETFYPFPSLFLPLNIAFQLTFFVSIHPFVHHFFLWRKLKVSAAWVSSFVAWADPSNSHRGTAVVIKERESAPLGNNVDNASTFNLRDLEYE